MNEEEIKNKIIVPFLNTIGIKEDELSYETSFKILLGRTKVNNEEINLKGRLDILVKYNLNNLFIFELKAEDVNITEDVIKQGLSYARLLEDIPPYTIISNGKDTKIFNSITGGEEAHIDKEKRIQISESIMLRMNALKNIITYSQENIKVFIEKFNERELARLKNNKYIREIVVEREKPIELFENFLVDQNKIFFVYGDSGSGKTNLLCDLYYKFNEECLILFYNSSFISESIVNKIKDDFNFGFSEQYEIRTIFERLNQIASEKNKKIIIFIDALDELKIEEPVIKIDELINSINEFDNIKLCVSCKTTFKESISNLNGINSVFEMTKKVSLKLDKFNEIEKIKILNNYSKYYNVTVDLEAIERLKSINNGILFRIIFESYREKEINKNTSIDGFSIIESYINSICEYNRWNILEFKDTLKSVAEIYMEAKEGEHGFYLDIDELDVYNKLSNKKISLQDLYDKYILEKNEIYGKYNSIEFYYKPILYYCVCILCERIHTKKGQELYDTLSKLNKNRRLMEALSWYGENVSNNEQLGTFIDFKKDEALKFLLDIRKLINENYSVINDKFECNIDINKVGICVIGNHKIYGGISYCFFIKSDDESDVIYLDHCPQFGELNTGNSLSINSTVSKLSAVKYVNEKIIKIIKNMDLDESNCKYMTQEKIILLSLSYNEKFNFKKISNNRMFLMNDTNAYPLKIDIILNLIEQNIYNEYVFFKKNKALEESVMFDEYKENLINGNKETPIIATLFNKNIYNIIKILKQYKEKYGNEILSLPYIVRHNDKMIDDSMCISERQFSGMDENDIKIFFEDLVIMVLGEYINLVETNFYNDLEKLNTYINLKKGVDIKIYFCKNKKKECILRSNSIYYKVFLNNKSVINVTCEVIEEEFDSKSFFIKEDMRIMSGSTALIDIYGIGNDFSDSMINSNIQYSLLRKNVYKIILGEYKNIIAET